MLLSLHQPPILMRNSLRAIQNQPALASILYEAVTLIAVLTVPVSLPSHSSESMALVVDSHCYMAPGSIAFISMLAVVNG